MVKGVKPAAKSMVLKRPAAVVLPLRKRPAAAISQPLPTPCATPPPALAEESVLPDWYGEADEDVQRGVYLVTAAKLVNAKDPVQDAGEQPLIALRDPSTISKKQFREALQDSIANPIYEHKKGGRPSTLALELDVYVGVMEGKPGEQHHHAAVKLFEAARRFMPFKLAMRRRHGLRGPDVPEMWARCKTRNKQNQAILISVTTITLN